jgi:hypothetical protein
MVAFATLNGDTLARAALSLHRPDEWPEGRRAVIAAIERGDLSAIAFGGQYRIAAESVWRIVPEEIRATWPEGRWRVEDPEKD